jgi:anti-anti-sigma factor
MSEIASLGFEEDEQVPLARISGQIDMSNAASLAAAILDAVDNRSAGLVLDVREVDYMDSAGVSLLADLQKRLGWRGQRFGVIAFPGSRPLQVLALAGADGLIPFDRTPEAARERIVSREIDRPEGFS